MAYFYAVWPTVRLLLSNFDCGTRGGFFSKCKLLKGVSPMRKNSAEEEIANGDGSHNASQIGEQAGGHGVTRVADAHTAEVNGENIERGVGAALENARQAPHKRIRPVGGHRVDHHSACAGARQWFHQGGGQRTHPLCVEAAALNCPRHAVDERIHRAAGAKHADGHEHRYEIRDDAHGGFKTRFRPFDKGVVDVDLLAQSCEDEGGDEGEQEDVGAGCADAVHHFGVEGGEAPNDAGNDQRSAAEREQQGAVEEVDALKKRGDDHAGQGRKECGQEDGDENVRGIGRTLLCAIDHDGDRDEREPTCVEHQEHDHGIARAIFLRIEFLQSFHRLEAERCGGVVEAKHVGGDVHKDVTHHGVAFRNLGEEAFEHRAEESRHKLNDSTAFADLHHAHPKRQYSGESERNFKSRLRRFESRVHNRRKDVKIAHEHEAKGGNDEGDEKKSNPNIIEYHGVKSVG